MPDTTRTSIGDDIKFYENHCGLKEVTFLKILEDIDVKRYIDEKIQGMSFYQNNL